MGEKQLMSEKILNISRSLNVSKKDIKLIITSYLIYKQRELLNGREIKISNIVEIVPEPLLDNTITTLAFVAKEISDIHSFTFNTVLTILNYYIAVQTNQLMAGRPVDFRGLVKIHPKIERNRIKAIHSSISVVITNRVLEEGRLESVRVHTAKALKQQVYNRQINYIESIEDDLDEELELELM